MLTEGDEMSNQTAEFLITTSTGTGLVPVANQIVAYSTITNVSKNYYNLKGMLPDGTIITLVEDPDATYVNIKTTLFSSEEDIATLSNLLTGKANVNHAHSISEITSLPTTLDDLTHSISLKANLVDVTKALNLKANASDVYKKSEINDLVTATSSVQIVDTINIRNTSGNKSKFVFVRDATGDVTVKSGAATYIWDTTLGDNGDWRKVCEAESMDIDEYLEGKLHSHPNLELLNSYTESNSEIQTTIQLRHIHQNKSYLDKFGETLDGTPTYAGKTIATIENVGNANVVQVDYPFSLLAGETTKRFDLSTLGISRGTDVTVWYSNPATGEEKLEPDIWYTPTELTVHLDTFSEGQYLLKFIKITAVEGALTDIEKQYPFTILSTEVESMVFTKEALGLTYNADVNVWAENEDGSIEKTSMDVRYDATGRLIVGTLGWPAGQYYLRYYVLPKA